MPIDIRITYPASPPATSDEIAVLKSKDDVLTKNLVRLTVKNFEKYEWVLDERETSGRYFALKCTTTGENVFTENINQIKGMEPECFIRHIEFKRVSA